jgi:tetratricopeptide (TPR) repeat protein
VRCMELAVQVRGAVPALLLDLAYAYGCALRHPEAVATFERLLELDPRHVEALGGIAFSLRAMNRAQAAADYLKRAIALAPDEPRWLCDLGAVEEELGNFVTAEQFFRRALALKPNFPIAIAHLLGLRKGIDDATLVQKGEQHMSGVGLQKPVRVQLAFALGKHFDSVRDYDRAFTHYSTANELVAAGRPYLPELTQRQIDSLIQTFDRELFARLRSIGHSSERPLFIVGMPRSGTTLTEQILASHREIAGAGELGYFNFSAQQFQRQHGAADDASYVHHLDATALERCAKDYLEQLTQVSGSARRVVDKMPMNFLQIGLIALTFPNARIIHCRRNPLDTCLSCYFENFHEDQRYSTDLVSVGHFYREYERLMRHWQAVAPLPILDVCYEDVVGDIDAHAHRLIDFCGLDWDPNCLEFHRTARSVNTPSRWQVRQPIYKTSVERWRNYEKHLAPLIEALDFGRAPILE